MIQWLNKQLNEKPGSTLGGNYMPPTSVLGGATKYGITSGGLTASMGKPPAPTSTGISAGGSFRPTFASLEQMNNGGNAR